MYEQIIREATKDLVGKPLDQDTLVERLTKVLMKVIPKPQLEEVQVSTEDGRGYEIYIPLPDRCMSCGSFPLVKENHPTVWGMFVCSECGEGVHG